MLDGDDGALVFVVTVAAGTEDGIGVASRRGNVGIAADGVAADGFKTAVSSSGRPLTQARIAY